MYSRSRSNQFRAFLGVISLVTLSFAMSAGAASAVPGEYLVRFNAKFKKSAGSTASLKQDAQLMSALQRVGVSLEREFDLIPGWAKVKVSSQKASAAFSQLKANGVIEVSEPNWIYRAFDMQTDSRFAEQWALKNVGQGGGTPGADISAIPAWSRVLSDKPVVVAVIDTGVDYTHPDLKNQMWKNTGEIPGDGVDNDGNGYIDDVYGWNVYKNHGDPKDDFFHGTHCAGIIAAAHDGQGIMGVAPQAKIMAVKFLGHAGNGTLEGAILGTEYAIKNGAQILSNSWGGDAYSEAMKAVIEYANEKGILYIAAAGNEHNNNDVSPTYPASYQVDNVISVAASENRDDVTFFSNWGAKSVHLTAPGMRVLGPVLKDAYKEVSGTSMACPHVAGAAALILSSSPDLKPAEVKARLLKTVDKRHHLRGMVQSGGRLNLLQALLDQETPEPPATGAPWVEVPYVLESEHPYPSLVNQRWKIRHPGAKEMRLHFTQVHLQTRVDYIAIRNEAGKVVETLSGNQGELWSRPVPGEVLTLEIRSDSDQEYFGFAMDKYSYR